VKTTGNTILIAGGTSGIGLALAERLHALGNASTPMGMRGSGSRAAQLAELLLEQSEEFRTLWEAHEVASISTRSSASSTRRSAGSSSTVRCSLTRISRTG